MSLRLGPILTLWRFDQPRFALAWGRAMLPVTTLAAFVVAGRGKSHLALAMVAIAAVAFGLVTGGIVAFRDRTEGVRDYLRGLPISRDEFAVAKAAAVATTGLASVGVSVLVGYIAFRVMGRMPSPQLAGLIIAGVAAGVVAGGLVLTPVLTLLAPMTAAVWAVGIGFLGYRLWRVVAPSFADVDAVAIGRWLGEHPFAGVAVAWTVWGVLALMLLVGARLLGRSLQPRDVPGPEVLRRS